ncbi:Meckel syndrome type 1 protein [Cephus cinctus]|uniref:Meckel syndrome type 1 protein n=1 Tax=Cephus cinctus TaxID=211228 RepID=A0AAJ7FI11_CEPCN|nr:Meckel syndrome type 1 protein [Cephus cinctus]
MLEKLQGKMKIAGSYRVVQPIENFKIKVKIIQQRSTLAELFENEDETRDSNFLEDEEYLFTWQEKVFAPFEASFYREEKNCVTEQQKQYHQRILEENIQGSRLFSYTQQDSYYPDDALLTTDYRSILSLRNPSALPMLRNRKPFTERYNKKILDDKPTDTRIRSNHYLYQEREIMYIMVDLTPKDEVSTNIAQSQTLLCTITYDKTHKILSVNPDFSNEQHYIVDGIGMSYDYWIEHASEKPDAEALQRERDIARHELREKQIYKEAEIFQEFELPAENILRVILNLDIISAHDFPYDALFITYVVELPTFWSTNRRETLSGRTQRSRMRKETSNFCYVAEILLDLDLNCLNDENVLPSWPTILLSVGSLDSWTRYRIEGYASFSLPPSAGTHTITLETWRPVAGLVNSLRRFFTGGTYELEDMSYCGIPSRHDKTKLEKSDLSVVPSGSVKLRMSIVHQSRSFTRERGFRRDTFERLSAGTLMSSVNNVLEQFKAARERMIRARAVFT